MEALIQPDIGLSFWTILCFVLLLVILKKTAWKPLIDAINEREEGLRRNLDSADQARKESEKIRDELNARLAAVKTESNEMLEDAHKMAEKSKEAIIAAANKSAASKIASAKKEIEAERVRAFKDMKRKVSHISLMAASKIMGASVDESKNAEISERFIDEAEKEIFGINDDSSQK